MEGEGSKKGGRREKTGRREGIRDKGGGRGREDWLTFLGWAEFSSCSPGGGASLHRSHQGAARARR
jgi:hypothetical protein